MGKTSLTTRISIIRTISIPIMIFRPLWEEETINLVGTEVEEEATETSMKVATKFKIEILELPEVVLVEAISTKNSLAMTTTIIRIIKDMEISIKKVVDTTMDLKEEGEEAIKDIMMSSFLNRTILIMQVAMVISTRTITSMETTKIKRDSRIEGEDKVTTITSEEWVMTLVEEGEEEEEVSPRDTMMTTSRETAISEVEEVTLAKETSVTMKEEEEEIDYSMRTHQLCKMLLTEEYSIALT